MVIADIRIGESYAYHGRKFTVLEIRDSGYVAGFWTFEDRGGKETQRLDTEKARIFKSTWADYEQREERRAAEKAKVDADFAAAAEPRKMQFERLQSGLQNLLGIDPEADDYFNRVTCRELEEPHYLSEFDPSEFDPGVEIRVPLSVAMRHIFPLVYEKLPENKR